MDAGGQIQMVRSESPAAHLSKVKMQYPFYHTTDEIRSEVVRLSKKCPHLNMTTLKDSNVDIDVITVRKASATPVNKVFLLFGEHARELISPESGLYFLRALCGDVALNVPAQAGLLEGSSPLSLAEQVLEDSEFQIILNANPGSRRKVEAGDYCLRMNPNGVDINRNWDERWQKDAATSAETNPGAKPFSEPESRIVKKAVTDFAPTTFLTVHSGTKGMYMPWAYDRTHLAQFNGKHMMDVLTALDKDHCECPFGAAGMEVGYPCPGTCLDYAYAKLNTPFSFAFEIYTDHSADSDLKERWAKKLARGGAQLLEKAHHLGHAHFKDVFDRHKSDFVGPSSLLEQSAEHEHALADDACFGMFNPEEQDDYNKTVKNWAEAYLQMSALIAKKVKNGDMQKGKVTEPEFFRRSP